MGNIVIDHNLVRPQIERLQREFAGMPLVIDRVMVSAINKTVRGVTTDIGREIRRHVNLKARDIREVIRDRRARRRQSGGPRGSVHLSESYRFGLERFGARQTRTGVSYRIGRGGARSTIPGAFIVESRGGSVFRRTTDKRLPIVRLRGLSPWGAYTRNPSIDRNVREKAAERLGREVTSQIDRQLAKGGRR